MNPAFEMTVTTAFRPFLLQCYLVLSAPLIILLIGRILWVLQFSTGAALCRRASKAFVSRDFTSLAVITGSVPERSPETGLRAFRPQTGEVNDASFHVALQAANRYFVQKIQRLKVANDLSSALWRASIVVGVLDLARFLTFLFRAFSFSKVNPFWLTADVVSHYLQSLSPWFVYMFVAYLASKYVRFLLAMREIEWLSFVGSVNAITSEDQQRI
jgi:hypothetical protein